MYFRKLALLFALATATANPIEPWEGPYTSEKPSTMPTPTPPPPTPGHQCNNIVNVAETIDDFNYAGLVVVADSSTDPDGSIVGHLSITTSSGTVASIELLQSSLAISAGDTTLVLDPTVPSVEINGEPVTISVLIGLLEAVQDGILTGILKDIAEAFEGMITWIDAQVIDDDDPEAEVNWDDASVSNFGECSYWTHAVRLAKVVKKCGKAGSGWALCVQLVNPYLCLASLGLSVGCAQKVQKYAECF